MTRPFFRALGYDPAMAGPRWRSVVLPLVLCGLSIASCRYLAFDRELQELRTLGTVRGTAESGEEQPTRLQSSW